MATESSRIHTFFVMKEAGKPERILVWDTQEISLGRSSENDIAIDHAEISRKHVQFVRTDKSYVVQNLNTSNGTLVNETPVTTRPLESGDVIRVAELELCFYQSAKDPVSLGKKVDYASQFKEFAGPSISAADAEATMLGLIDDLPGSDEDFEVKPASDFAYDLHQMESGSVDVSAPRDLDLELEGFGLDDLDIPDGVLTPPSAPAPDPAPDPVSAPAPATAPAPRATAADEAWDLDEVAEPPAALSLQLEIDGLQGELRRVLQGLVGKVVELPAMKIRIKGGDLG
jgi:predicted component of type VI protein secretion system